MTTPDDRFARIGALFDEALALAPSDRAAFLDRACAGDPDARAEVLALIGADAKAGGFLAPEGPGVGALLLGDQGDARPPGTMLGAYRIERRLGFGGMGAVYLADDTVLGRPVTLKVLHPDEGSADATRHERLRFEARAAAGLAHPNIATVYALEEFDGELCMVGEFVPGRTARELLDAGPLDLALILRVATDVARALEAAHARGILHRDLKPENILVGDNGVTRVLDFGIARPIAPQEGTRLTATGMVIGTPGYISPEQLEGKPGDARSDLFSFGIVLYELVTGANPFQGATPVSTAARILTLAPPPPSRMNPLSPPALDAVVARCLRKDPHARYAAAAALIADLEHLAEVIAGGAQATPPEPVIASRDAAGLRARTWWRIHQRAVILVVGLLAIGGWWVASWVGGPVRYALFACVLALAVADGTLRVNLLFVERQRLPARAVQLARARPWLLALELVMGLLCAGMASLVLAGHPAVGAAMLAVSAAMIVTVWAIEPATAAAAFTDADSAPPRIPSSDRSG
jgi:serine/threonine protein kinase